MSSIKFKGVLPTERVGKRTQAGKCKLSKKNANLQRRNYIRKAFERSLNHDRQLFFLSL